MSLFSEVASLFFASWFWDSLQFQNIAAGHLPHLVTNVDMLFAEDSPQGFLSSMVYLIVCYIPGKSSQQGICSLFLITLLQSNRIDQNKQQKIQKLYKQF